MLVLSVDKLVNPVAHVVGPQSASQSLCCPDPSSALALFPPCLLRFNPPAALPPVISSMVADVHPAVMTGIHPAMMTGIHPAVMTGIHPDVMTGVCPAVVPFSRPSPLKSSYYCSA